MLPRSLLVLSSLFLSWGFVHPRLLSAPELCHHAADVWVTLTTFLRNLWVFKSENPGKVNTFLYENHNEITRIFLLKLCWLLNGLFPSVFYGTSTDMISACNIPLLFLLEMPMHVSCIVHPWPILPTISVQLYCCARFLYCSYVIFQALAAPMSPRFHIPTPPIEELSFVHL